ncbi:hypothetical protein ACE1B6_12585 [Aerosakkonemataceae cyanobacterium BLCC-F154]|uniref:Uncharacterized protein n=1 Tax=Floridaenema fluviatile BLCC-F154 TaxID=3153640 RepID=A0ABV4YB98_9CYAN
MFVRQNNVYARQLFTEIKEGDRKDVYTVEKDRSHIPPSIKLSYFGLCDRTLTF